MKPKVKKVLFVCHGNICRSVMAQCIMQKLVDDRGLSGEFVIDSAATTFDEIGNPIYPPARKKLAEKGVPIVPHSARRVQAGEGAGWDYVLIMDEENLRHLRRIWGPENLGNVHMLMSFAPKSTLPWQMNELAFEGAAAGNAADEAIDDAAGDANDYVVATDTREVADPWFTRDFETTYQDVLAGCQGFLEHLS